MHKPSDWIKQPLLDLTRFISSLLYRMFPRKAERQVSAAPVTRLLVVRRNRLGDAVSTLPLLQGLARDNHDLVIDVVANPYNAAIFRRAPGIHDVFEVPERFIGNRWLVFLHPEIRRLRSQRPYDVVFNASGAYSSNAAWLAFLAPGRLRVGVVSSRGSIWDRVWDVPVRLGQGEPQRGHQVKHLLAIAKHAGLTPEVVSESVMRTKALRVPRLIGLCPIVARSSSRWPDEKWDLLAKRLVSTGWNVQWVGHRPAGSPGDLASPAGTEAFIELLAQFSILVCSEGGASHLAPAVGTPTIALSGVRVRDTWRPWSNRAVLLEKTACIESIDVDDVIAQLQCWHDNARFAQTEIGFTGTDTPEPGQTTLLAERLVTTAPAT